MGKKGQVVSIVREGRTAEVGDPRGFPQEA